jgi:PIN domain nuclease of toxin-antitoxin system
VSAIADSCALIVFLRDPDAQRTMPNAFPYLKSRPVHVPPMVVWEISRLIAFGKLPRLPVALPDLLRAHGFAFLPMTWEVAEAAETLPPIHRDPVDRIIVAHALRQDMPILTSDGTIPAYGVTTIW